MRKHQSRLEGFGSLRLPKRAQMIGQVFIFILAGLVFVLILAYGYRAISGFLERGEQVQLLDFKNELESTVNTIKRDYGSVQRVDLRVPPKTEQVCLVNVELQDPSAFKDAHPLLYTAWSAGSENIFLIPRQPTPILIPDILVDPPGFLCVPATGGRISLRVEGTGSRALVKPWPAGTQ